MDDYCGALFAACTDFRVGEAVKYLKNEKSLRIVVRYRSSEFPRKDEDSIIRELQLSGVRLLNDLISYDYRTANCEEERAAVKKFCDILFSEAVGKL